MGTTCLLLLGTLLPCTLNVPNRQVPLYIFYFLDWKSFSISCMNPCLMLRGRPHRGVAILYKMFRNIGYLNFISKCVCAIKC